MNVVFKKNDVIIVDDITDEYFVIAYHNESEPLILARVDDGKYFFATGDFMNRRGSIDRMTHSTPKELIEAYREQGFRFWATKKNHEFYAQMIKIYNGDDSYPS